MKRLTVALALLFATSAAVADVTITYTLTDAQGARLTRAMKRHNRSTCNYYGLPNNCTQPQARTAFCERAGFPATSACDGSAQVDVFSDLSKFAKREGARLITEEYASKDAAEDAAAFDAAKSAASTEQKNAVCAALGLPAGCLP